MCGHVVQYAPIWKLFSSFTIQKKMLGMISYYYILLFQCTVVVVVVVLF